MTPAPWLTLLAYWIDVLELKDRQITIRMVPAKAIPACDMQVGFVDREARNWLIQIRRGYIPDGEAVLVHELLHVRTGRLDARDEANLWTIARALVRLRHAAS